jgi:hypothetical protein
MSAGPQNFRIGAGALSIEGQDVGLTTEDGVVVNYEPDVHLHTSGKYGTTPVKASLIGQKLTLEVWMAEHTFENIESAYAGVVNNSGQINFGGLAGREVEGKELILTPFDGTAAWYFRNAVPTEAVEAAYKVGDERIIHVTFTAMVDIDATEESNLGYLAS